MNPAALDFLRRERMSLLCLLLEDGSPHAAAMHFDLQDDPLILYFSTHFGNRKLAGLQAGRTQASVVVGFSETDWITLQMDGHCEIITPAGSAPAKNLLLAKYPEAAKHISESTVFLKFTPAWYRYTEFKSNPLVKIEQSL